MSHVDRCQNESYLPSHSESYKLKGESPLWVTWWCDVSRDITPHSTSFLSSKRPDVCGTGGIGDVGVIIGDSANLSLLAMLIGVATMGLDVPGAIAENALGDLGAALH